MLNFLKCSVSQRYCTWLIYVWSVLKLTKLYLWAAVPLSNLGISSGFPLSSHIKSLCLVLSALHCPMTRQSYGTVCQPESETAVSAHQKPRYLSRALHCYRLLLFILIFNLMVYLFCNCIERKQAQLKVQAKLTDVWIADYRGTEEECLPHLLVCQSLKNPAQLLL